MNSYISKTSSQTAYPYRNSLGLSTETKQLLSIGDQHGWNFQVLGQAPFPETTIRIGDWLLSPAETDSSLVPDRTLTRIQAIFAAGIRPQGFVVAHEAPKLLSSPAIGKAKKSGRIPISFPHTTFLPSIDTATVVLGFIAKVIKGIASAIVSFLSFAVPLLLTSTLFMGAVLIDPILVAVTDDGTWIEVDRWNLLSE